jgi:hypothetical protein
MFFQVLPFEAYAKYSYPAAAVVDVVGEISHNFISIITP